MVRRGQRDDAAATIGHEPPVTPTCPPPSRAVEPTLAKQFQMMSAWCRARARFCSLKSHPAFGRIEEAYNRPHSESTLDSEVGTLATGVRSTLRLSHQGTDIAEGPCSHGGREIVVRISMDALSAGQAVRRVLPPHHRSTPKTAPAYLLLRFSSQRHDIIHTVIHSRIHSFIHRVIHSVRGYCLIP